jgi:FkbM family methyltransferase
MKMCFKEFKAWIKRVLLWRKFLTGCDSLDHTSFLNLLTSAFVDLSGFFTEKPIRNPKLRKSGLYRIKPYGFVVYARGGTEDLYYAIPGREGAVNDFIWSKLESGDFFVDIGANIGYYTLLGSKKVGSSGHVLAIEPVPETARVLKLNLLINHVSNVKVVNKAAWYEKSEIKIGLPTGFFGFASAVVNYEDDKTVLKVEAVPSDDLLRSQEKVKLIKIDVEGSELQVLKGLSQTLPRTAYLSLEASTHGSKIIELLKEKGFACHPVGFSDYVICVNKALL